VTRCGPWSTTSIAWIQPPDALHGALRRVLLGKAGEMARQRDDAVLHDHADVGGIDHRVPLEFGQDVILDLAIGFHRDSFRDE